MLEDYTIIRKVCMNTDRTKYAPSKPVLGHCAQCSRETRPLLSLSYAALTGDSLPRIRDNKGAGPCGPIRFSRVLAPSRRVWIYAAYGRWGFTKITSNFCIARGMGAVKLRLRYEAKHVSR